MDIREKFYEIMEQEKGIDEVIEEVKEMLEEEVQNNNIKTYEILEDMDVFDSPGLDIYYVSISWVDSNSGKLVMAGSSYWRH